MTASAFFFAAFLFTAGLFALAQKNVILSGESKRRTL
jgi:hypothetical protein